MAAIARFFRPPTVSSWLCLAAMLSASPAGAEAPVPLDVSRWVADDAVVYLEITRPGDLIDRFKDDRVRGPLLSVPSVKSATQGEPFRRLDEVSRLISDGIGMSRDQALRGLTGGGIVFAVEVREGQPPHVYLVATPTDPGLLRKATRILVEVSREHAADQGSPDPIKTVEYRGATGYALGDRVIYGIVKDRLVIAGRGETGKMIVDRAEDGLGTSKPLADAADFRTRAGAAGPDATAWGLARLERLRKLDPKQFGPGEVTNPGEILLLGGWTRSFRQAPWIGASLTWTAKTLRADVSMPLPPGGRDAAFKAFVPPKDAGAPGLITPPGTIASLGLWRDLSAAWESRAELLPPEAVQGLAQLDTVAGQFFGGRDFGTGVLGALTSDWRLVVALQDVKALKPVPDVKLPAFALVAGLKPDDDDFAQRLKVAFQSFVGLTNLGAAQTKAPPLELGSETFEGVTISTSRFMAPKASAATAAGPRAKTPGTREAVNIRHNFSPSIAQVGNHFVIGSSVGITKDVVRALKSTGGRQDVTLGVEAEGGTLATLIDLNRDRLVMRNMLEKGHDRAHAEAEVGLLALLRYLGHGRLAVQDAVEATKIRLEFTLGN